MDERRIRPVHGLPAKQLLARARRAKVQLVCWSAALIGTALCVNIALAVLDQLALRCGHAAPC